MDAPDALSARAWIVVAGLVAALVIVQGTIHCDRMGSQTYLRSWPRSPLVLRLVNNLQLARTLDLTTLHNLQKGYGVGGEPQEGNR